jgi:hypothetical protein
VPIITEMIHREPATCSVAGRQLGDLPNMIQPPLLGVVNAASAVSRPNPDLPCASRAAELLDAVGVHGRASAPVPQIAAARAERVRSLDPDIARVECEGIAALDAVPLEALQKELRHRLPHVVAGALGSREQIPANALTGRWQPGAVMALPFLYPLAAKVWHGRTRGQNQTVESTPSLQSQSAGATMPQSSAMRPFSKR